MRDPRFLRLFLQPVAEQCDVMGLALYRITRDGLALQAAAGDEADTAPETLPLGGCSAGTAARKGERRPATEVEPADATFPDAACELIEPVLFDGLPVGVLVAASGVPHGLDGWTGQVVALLAERVAPVLAWPDEAAALAASEVVDELAARFEGRFDWTGVYAAAGDDVLQLVAFVGEPTPHVRIPVSTGLCGAAVRENAELNVADVRADPRYLACSLRTRSELVVPIRDGSGKAVAELDIDSDRAGTFGPDALEAVRAAAARLAPHFDSAR